MAFALTLIPIRKYFSMLLEPLGSFNSQAGSELLCRNQKLSIGASERKLHNAEIATNP